jgi:pimeloyl-ACP methyl ester carboxylesterase
VSLPGRFVDTSAGRVYVHRVGRGEPLLLLHGYMMSHYYFRQVLPAFAAQHDVIALDLLGFGESDRPDPPGFSYDLPSLAGSVGEVLDKLGIEHAKVLGHSLGGGVALTLAARRPELVTRLVLVCPTVYPLPIPLLGKVVLQPTIGKFLFKNAFTKFELRRQMLAQHFKDPAPVTDELVDYVWARLNRAGGRDAAYALLHTMALLSDANADPGRVRAPTLLVWGDEDRMVPLAHGKRLSHAIAGARLAVVPDCGHNVHLERPDEFLRQVLPFLADTTLGPVAETPVPALRAQAIP